MIWEQSVSIIVMLTKCSENNMVCEMGGGVISECIELFYKNTECLYPKNM